MSDILARMRQIIGATADWAAHNIVLGDGELAIERTSAGVKAKVGNGVLTFSAAPYLTADPPAGYLLRKGDADMTVAAPATPAVGDSYRNTKAGAGHASWGGGNVVVGQWKMWDGTAWRDLGGGLPTGSVAVGAAVDPTTGAPPTTATSGTMVRVSAAGTPVAGWGLPAGTQLSVGDYLLLDGTTWQRLPGHIEVESKAEVAGNINPVTTAPPATANSGDIYRATAAGSPVAGWALPTGTTVQIGDLLMNVGGTWTKLSSPDGTPLGLNGNIDPSAAMPAVATLRVGVYTPTAAGVTDASWTGFTNREVLAGDRLLWDGAKWSVIEGEPGQLRMRGSVDPGAAMPAATTLRPGIYTPTQHATTDGSWTGIPRREVFTGDRLLWDGAAWSVLEGEGGALRFLGTRDLTAAPPANPQRGDTYAADADAASAAAAWNLPGVVHRGDLATYHNGAWEWLIEAVPTGRMVYRGDADLTAAVPVALQPLSTGDVVRNTKAGVPAASWTGIGGATGSALPLNQMVVYDGGNWRIIGPLIPPVLKYVGGFDVTAAKPGTFQPATGDVITITKDGTGHASWTGIGGITLKAGDLMIRSGVGTWDIIGTAAEFDMVVLRDGSKDMFGNLRAVGVELSTKSDGSGSGGATDSRVSYAAWIPQRASATEGGAMLQVRRADVLTDAVTVDKDGHVTPGADNTQDLGSALRRWRNLYATGINGGAGAVTIAAGGANRVRVNAAGHLVAVSDGVPNLGGSTTADRFANLYLTGNVYAGSGSAATPTYGFGPAAGNGMFLDAVTTSDLHFAVGSAHRVSITRDGVMPSADNARDLGSAALKFRRAFLGAGTLAAPALTFGVANSGFYAVGSQLHYGTAGVNTRFTIGPNGGLGINTATPQDWAATWGMLTLNAPAAAGNTSLYFARQDVVQGSIGNGQTSMTLMTKNNAMTFLVGGDQSTNQVMSLAADGVVTLRGAPTGAVGGSAAKPIFALASDNTTGIYWPTAGQLGIGAGANEVFRVKQAQGILINMPGANGAAGAAISAVGDIRIQDALAETNALMLDITGTEATINTRYGKPLRLGVNGGYSIEINGASGHVLPNADNTRDLGSTAARWKNGHFSGVVSAQDHVATSDRSKKERIGDRTLSLDDIARLQPRSWLWKHDGREDSGVIADELQALLPELVHGEPGEMTVSEGKAALVIALNLARELLAERRERKALVAKVRRLEEAVAKLLGD